MKRRIPWLVMLMAALGLCTPAASLHAETDAEVAARNAATSVAGAFTNGGFKLRDGHWTGRLQPGKSQVIQVNLFAGNQYWFSLGATPSAKRLSIAIYDEAGRPLASEPYAEDGKAAAGFSPEASGSYFEKVSEKEGGATAFCLIYSYK
jgi:hypothetical protein